LAETRQRNDRPAVKDEIGAIARSSARGRHRRYRGRPGGCRKKLSPRKPEPQAAECSEYIADAALTHSRILFRIAINGKRRVNAQTHFSIRQ
jgi:hypothetical protein